MSALEALASIAELGTIECQEWRTKIFARHPWLAKALAVYYRKRYERDGLSAANTWLREFEKGLKIGRSGLFCDSTDEQIIQYCDVKSRAIHGQIETLARSLKPSLYKLTVSRIAEVVAAAGVDFPLNLNTDYSKEQAIAALARVCDARWWRRKLRVLAARQLEHTCRSIGMVSARKAPYVSDFSLRRRGEQKHRNRQLLLALDAVTDTEDGDELRVNLGYASDAGVSNPVNRRNELMVRMRGYEEIAEATGFVGQFYTLTCPSAYHATQHSGQPNPKYNGTTPAEAQAYLCDVWARIRAKWQREGVRVFGFRIAEPHHDGTPHWHLLLFVCPDRAGRAAEIFGQYAMHEDTHEAGADLYRWKVITIDKSKGTATGYIAKYVSKNIDGYGMGADEDHETGTAVIDTAKRVEAWAGVWGIRQFQQIGSASVTVWREFRRVREAMPEGAGLAELEAIRQACDAGDWKLFVELMGGALVGRDALTVRALHVQQEQENQYGEVCSRLMGIVMRGVVRQITRLQEWRIDKADEETLRAGGVWRRRPEPERRGLDLCQ